MAITPESFEAATRRGARSSSEYGATSVRYDVARGLVRVALVSGQELVFTPLAIDALQDATDEALAKVTLSPSKLGLYFSELDVDLSIPNLVHSEDGRRIRLIKLAA